MNNITNSVRKSIQHQNWYAALFVTLTLPDICVALEDGKTSGSKYSSWFESNLTQYKGFLSGNDCYALRCALLHQGKDDILDQGMRQTLEHYVFITSGSHCNLFKDCILNGVKKSFLQLNVQRFCEDMCIAVENWLTSEARGLEIQKRLKETIEIHEPGYSYMGIIKFT
ncbi:MAG: hypothetical protein Q7R79_03715 [bacterium]|nr:hypothetical protein [bacterium]